MKTTGNEKFVYAILCMTLAVSVSAIAASSHESRNGRATSENREALFGNYSCGVGFEDGNLFTYFFFEATGDIFRDSPFLSQNALRNDPTAEVCEGLAESVGTILSASGCTVGPKTRSEDSGGASLYFGFVCHAPRSEVISVVADLGAAQLATSF